MHKNNFRVQSSVAEKYNVAAIGNHNTIFQEICLLVISKSLKTEKQNECTRHRHIINSHANLSCSLKRGSKSSAATWLLFL